MSSEIHNANPDDESHPQPNIEPLLKRMAETEGNHWRDVVEVARTVFSSSQGGIKAKMQQLLEVGWRRYTTVKENLREAKSRKRHIEPTVIARGQRTKIGAAGLLMLVVLLATLTGMLWVENGAAAQALLSTGAFDVATLEGARQLMLTPIIIGIALIAGFKMLPHFVRRHVPVAAVAMLVMAGLIWAVCFAIQAEAYRNDAAQTISLASQDSDSSSGEAGEVAHTAGGWPAWLMFGSLVVTMALTTFIGHTGVAHYLSRYETWVDNSEYTRALTDEHAYEHDLRQTEDLIVRITGRLGRYQDEENAFIARALAIYKSLKWQSGGSGGLAAIALVAGLLTGCVDAPAGSGDTSSRITSRMQRLDVDASKRDVPVTRVLAISPVLPAAEKAIAREQIEAEIEWIAAAAPVGSATLVVDALKCEPIARLEAVPGVARIRKKALVKPAIAIREFLGKPNPRAKDDGRVHLPRLAQTAKQWQLPAGTHLIVLGNPLFLNDGKDKFFSMADGRVPSDGCLYQEPKLNIFSIRGREKALAGVLVHLGWSDDAVFEDDTHRQAVLRFWSLYFQAQSAHLVTAQPSFVAAIEAAREGATEPLMYADADTSAEPAMVKIVKVQRHEEIKIEAKATDDAKQETDAERAAKEAEKRRAAQEVEAAAKAAQQETETANALREAALRQELAKVEANKPVLDQYGNLKGSDKDLIKDGQMKGQRILMAKFFRDDEVDASPLADALTAKGYRVEQMTYPLPPLSTFEKLLDQTQQLWIWSSRDASSLPKSYRAAIIQRWKAGRLSLCLLADNIPFTAEASALLGEISPGSTIEGDYRGEQTLRARTGSGGGFNADSPLFHNLSAIFEGCTISSPRGPGLVPVCYASNGAPLIATLQRPGSSRLIVHGGFTSFFRQFWDDAGISRFAVNSAGWLSGADAALGEMQGR